MKTTVFAAAGMTIKANDAYNRVQAVVVPTLSAYGVEWAEFTPPPHVDVGYRSLRSEVDFKIEGDLIEFASPVVCSLMGGLGNSVLVVHYHGIRDYEALFPQIAELRLRTRLGRFYEEAEITFENGAWLSFTLMAAAVYEGLLGWRLRARNQTFAQLIECSLSQQIIDQHEERILTSARESRNLVHAARFADPAVTRTSAMDMRTVMDGLIRKLAAELLA